MAKSSVALSEFQDDSFIEERDAKSRYQYVFFSPSKEIFNRLDQVLSTVPVIQKNLA